MRPEPESSPPIGGLDSIAATLPLDPRHSISMGGPVDSVRVVFDPEVAPSDIETHPTWAGKPGETGVLADDSYELRRLAGRGGFGEVWEALQVSLGRPVAIKRLREDRLQHTDPDKREETLRAFRQEALTAARLEHPNIVPVYDLGNDGTGHPLIAMRLARGREWVDLIAEDRESLSVEDFLARHLPILISVGQAVAFAHSRGVVHRDIKPGQVIVGEFGEVLLVDWGLAVLFDDRILRAEGAGEGVDDLPTKATASSPAGTPALMAPEQVRFDASGIGPWTDVYLLGGTLYFLLTGTYPHESDSAMDSMKRAMLGDVQRPEVRARARLIPSDLSDLCVHCLQREPSDRPGGARLFVEALDGHLKGTTKRRASEAITAGVGELLGSASNDYAQFNECANRLTQARELWPQNPALRPMQEKLHTAYARAALGNVDLRLAAMQAEMVPEGEERRSLEVEIARAEARARRHARQRRVAIVVTLVLLLAIVGGSLRFSARLQTEKSIAEGARQRAERAETDATVRRHQAESLFDFALGDLRSRLKETGRLDLLDQTADRALAYYADQNPLRMPEPDAAKLLASLDNLQDIYAEQGKQGKSLDVLDVRQRKIQALRTRDSKDANWVIAQALNDERRAWRLLDSGKIEEAEESAGRALEVYGGLDGAVRETQLTHIFETQNLLANIEGTLGKDAEAMVAIKASIDAATGALRMHPKDAELLNSLALAHFQAGEWYVRNQDGESALKSNDSRLAVYSGLSRETMKGGRWERGLAKTYQQRVDALRLLGRVEEAAGAADRSIELFRELSESAPTDIAWLQDLGSALKARGLLFDSTFRSGAHRVYFEESASIYRRIMELDPGTPAATVNYAASLLGISNYVYTTGDADSAIPYAMQFLEVTDKLVGDSALGSTVVDLRATAWSVLGRIYMSKKDFLSAAEWSRKSVEAADARLRARPKDFLAVQGSCAAYHTLAKALVFLGDFDSFADILAEYRERVDGFRDSPADANNIHRSDALRSLWSGLFRESKGDLAGAREEWEMTARLVEGDAEAGDLDSAQVLASALVLLGCREEALEWREPLVAAHVQLSTLDTILGMRGGVPDSGH